LYFDAVVTLSEMSWEERLDLSRTERTSSHQVRVRTSDICCLLFLGLHLRRGSGGAAIVNTVWPDKDKTLLGTAAGGAALSPAHVAALSAKEKDDAGLRGWVKQHLAELVPVFALVGGERGLSRAAVDSMGFMFRGGPSLVQARQRLSTCSPLFADLTRSAAEAEVVEWLGAALVANPVLYPVPTPRSPGGALSPDPQGQQQQQQRPPHGEGSPVMIVDGRDTVGAELVDGDIESTSQRRPVVVAMASKKTVVLAAPECDLAPVRLICLSHCTVYVLAPVRSLSLFGCTAVNLVCGAVETGLVMEHCSHLTVTAAARAVRVVNCHSLSLFLASATAPVVSGEVHGVTLAPFNTTYPRLEEHLRAAGLNPRAGNLWDRPVVVTSTDAIAVPLALSASLAPMSIDDAQAAAAKDEASKVTLLDPMLFTSTSVPFNMPGETVANPFELPLAFSRALDARARATKDLREGLRATAAGDPDREREMQQWVQARFREWMASSGNTRVVQDLLHLESRR
jgi:hypothetical protein